MSYYPIPVNYTLSEWPGLYLDQGKINVLYHSKDLWYYITSWSTVLTASTYLIAFTWAYIVFIRYKWSFLFPIVGTIIGALIGFVGGSVIGIFVAAIYPTAQIAMSTWIALAWGLLYLSMLLIGSMITWSSVL